MNNVLKKFLVFCEYVLVFGILAIFCFYINKDIKIYGLYMDDLYNWSYFPETNIFTFAFKFYDNATRYRPIYDMMQYIEYTIAMHEPLIFSYFNNVVNILIALFIYRFVTKISKFRFAGILASVMYLYSHFSYYQIGQTIGLVESMSLFLSLFILYNSIQYLYDKTNKRYIFLVILFLIMVFTHERFYFMYAIIFFAIIFRELLNSPDKIDVSCIVKKIIILSAVVLFSLMIRYFAIGKIVPAGTGGTYVEDTFNIKQFIIYCINQVQYIFGINNGPDYLCGINFQNLNYNIRMLVFVQILIYILIFLVYFVLKIINSYNEKHSTKTFRKENIIIYIFKKFYFDIFMIMFIGFSIIFSSITIRVEMRFVYVSFVAYLIYFSYVVSYLIDISNTQIKTFVKFILLICFLSAFVLRLPAEKEYRLHYKDIYFFLDQDRMNSLAKATVYKYGNDVIDNKKVYILNNTYNMSKFYGDYFFQIYQKDFELRPITFIDDLSFLLNDDVNSNNTIILVEDYDIRGYKEFDIDEFKNAINLTSQ